MEADREDDAFASALWLLDPPKASQLLDITTIHVKSSPTLVNQQEASEARRRRCGALPVQLIL
jgi:hypothetical protein